ncbi:molybdopterin-guanine dinucleotide biosynthesis protein A [Methylobacterium oxalidis]|uniref:Molybdopterin-guanine dinucleotide biosynthesis protein A n=1 Tax=Methylobacterium oxalidis TaxID=944322 RepID=A0A512J760_9HYPH|nr:molybdopterin-guanine dinucleotide biosynthesis protein A [Methylobacterium oxalidis]GLS62634.1 molybdopterin-guanine dinucleotide biosynthesis protein A [Methylobacterium oxalidis]
MIVARRKLKSPWADHQWLPVGALPDVPATAPWTRLGGGPAEETFYAGAHEVGLHISETGHYRDNLVSGRPALWVALRHVGGDAYEIATVTADPYEGEALAEGIGEIVEAVPMPEPVQAVVAAFVEAFHIERSFEKRKRDRADPEALARRGIVGPRGGGSE